MFLANEELDCLEIAAVFHIWISAIQSLHIYRWNLWPDSVSQNLLSSCI